MDLGEQLENELEPIRQWGIRNKIPKDEFGKLIDLIEFNINQAIKRCREIADEEQRSDKKVIES